MVALLGFVLGVVYYQEGIVYLPQGDGLATPHGHLRARRC